MEAIDELAPDVPVAVACRALGVPRASYYRRRRPSVPMPRRARRPVPPPRKLSEPEEQQILDLAHSERFIDSSPAQIWATLVDEGTYIASMRTVYRVLGTRGEVRERRNQRRHPPAVTPVLKADSPNQVWSWDITKLRGMRPYEAFYLYVILDIFSRFVVAWMLAKHERATYATKLIEHACDTEKIEPGQLVLHSDRGSPMTAKPAVALMGQLGIDPSYSRPRTPNDNPYSESQFKTAKYRPGYPGRFGSYEGAQAYCRELFPWYNTEHRHSALCWLSPADVHHGHADEILDARQRTMIEAYRAHPERFVHGPPVVRRLPDEVWINQPTSAIQIKGSAH